MKRETAFSMETSSIKYGPGVTGEVGWDMEVQGAHRVMVVTDTNLRDKEPVSLTLVVLHKHGIDVVLYDQVNVEPTDASFKEAIKFAEEGNFDGLVAVGGGSSIDTAKAANLYSTYPRDFMTYVNPPIGEGKPVPGPLKPLTVEVIADGTYEMFVVRIPEVMGIRSQAVGSFFKVLSGLSGYDSHVSRIRQVDKHQVLAEVPKQCQLAIG